jgi:hypothetical protein
MRVSTIIIAVALFMGSQLATARAQSDNLIVPGVRIGPVMLAMTETAIYKMLGDPTRTMTQGVDMGRGIQYVYPTLSVVVNKVTHRVTSVVTIDQKYSTANGIKVGSSSLAVSTKLGIPPGDCQGMCDYNYHGIGMGINPDGRVRAIWIIPASR